MYRSFRPLNVALALFGALALSFSVSAATELPPLPEDYFPELKAILASAAAQSPRMIGRNAENALAEANLIQTRAGQLPNVGGYASYYPQTREKRAVTDPNQPEVTSRILMNDKTAYNFSINQPLFHWGALNNSTRMSKLQVKIAEGQTADAYRLLLQEIRTQYLQLIMKKADLVRAEFNLRRSESALALAKDKLSKNTGSSSQVFNSEIDYERSTIALDRSQESFASSKRLFARLTGTEVLRDDQIPDRLPKVTPDQSAAKAVIDGYVVKSELPSYQLDTLRYQIQSEKLNYKIQQVRLLPKVNLSAGVSRDEQAYTQNVADKYQVDSTYAGGSINWTVFDGLAARGAKLASLQRKRELERNYREATEDQLQRVRSALRQLEFSERNLAIAEKLLAVADNGVRVTKENLNRGVAAQTDLDLVTAQFLDTQSGTFTARYEYLMNASDVLSLTLEDPALANLSAR